MRHFLTLLFVLLLALPAVARDVDFEPVGVAQDALLPESQVQQVVQRLSAQADHPQAIVVLIHGWDTPRDTAEKLYDSVAKDIRADYERRGDQVAIIGLEWPSDVGEQRTWLPQMAVHAVASAVGLGNHVKNPYVSRVHLARGIGRRAARQIMLACQHQYPYAALDIYAYSMGADIGAAAMGGLPPDKWDKQATFEPPHALHVNVLYLAGADLDADVIERWPIQTGTVPRLLWLTHPMAGEKDTVLARRHLIVGKAPLGNAFPRMTLAELDFWIGQRHLLIDTSDIPKNHDYLTYYEPQRLQRLDDASLDVRDNTASHSVDLSELAAVAAAPATIKALAPLLDDDLAASQLLALYRLDKLVDGSALYLQNGEQMRLLSELRDDPRKAARAITQSPSRVVRDGYFPTREMLGSVPPHARLQAVGP